MGVGNSRLEWLDVRTRVLASVGGVKLCAGLGAIVEPYVIAFTCAHHVSVSELESSVRRDLLDSLDLCLYSGHFPSGALAVFEHGGLGTDISTACIEHCHLHVIDAAHDLRCQFELEFPEALGAAITEYEAFTPDSGSGYLFAGIYRGDRAIRGLLVHAPGCGSQFFRRLLAVQVQSSEWNWRVWPKPEAANRLCERWSSDGEETDSRVR
jgi:hypothetical protein